MSARQVVRSRGSGKGKPSLTAGLPLFCFWGALCRPPLRDLSFFQVWLCRPPLRDLSFFQVWFVVSTPLDALTLTLDRSAIVKRPGSDACNCLQMWNPHVLTEGHHLTLYFVVSSPLEGLVFFQVWHVVLTLTLTLD